MSDYELIEKMALDMYPAITMSVGETIAEKHINMVREHDQNQNLYIPEIKKKERAKVKAECIEAAKSCRREVYSRAGVHKCYDMDISFNQLIKALEDV